MTAEGDFYKDWNGKSCTEYVKLYKNGSLYKTGTFGLCLKNGSIVFSSTAGQHGSFYVRVGIDLECSSTCSYPGYLQSPTLTM